MDFLFSKVAGFAGFDFLHESLCFPAPSPGPNLYLTAPGPHYVFTGPGPQFEFPAPALNFCLPVLLFTFKVCTRLCYILQCLLI